MLGVDGHGGIGLGLGIVCHLKGHGAGGEVEVHHARE